MDVVGERGGVVVVDGMGEVGCAVEDEVDVVVAFTVAVAVAVDEPSVFLPSLDPPLVISVIAVAYLAGQSSTYVVSPPSSTPTAALPVGNSRYTPPCPSERTKIVTVTVSLAVLVDA